MIKRKQYRPDVYILLHKQFSSQLNKNTDDLIDVYLYDFLRKQLYFELESHVYNCLVTA